MTKSPNLSSIVNVSEEVIEVQAKKYTDLKIFIISSILIASGFNYILQSDKKDIKIEEEYFLSKIETILDKKEHIYKKEYLTLEKIEEIIKNKPNSKISVNNQEFSLKSFVRMFGGAYKKRQIGIQIYYSQEKRIYQYDTNVPGQNHLAVTNKHILNNTLFSGENSANMLNADNKEAYEDIFGRKYIEKE